MTTGFQDLLAANDTYAASFESGELPGPAARGVAVVTCMDSRIEPLQVLGLSLGDAKVLRNPGGRVTDDVLRALVLATHLLGVDRVMVIEHTDCRMAKVTDEQAHQAIRDVSGIDTRSLDFGTIPNQTTALQQDVQRIRSSPYVKQGVAVVGCLYDVHTGKVEVVVPPES
jgi:carbonic anhydrase